MVNKKSSKKSVRSKSKQYYKIALVAFTIAIVGVIYYRAQVNLQPQPVDIMEVGQAAGIVDLSFSSNDPQEIKLTINTENAKVTAAQIEIAYDSKLLGIPKVTIGDFFTLKLGDISTKDNLIKATVAVDVQSGGKAGSGTALLITFPQKPTQEAKISITNNTMVAAVNYDFNVLKNVASLTLSPTNSPAISNPIPLSQAPAPTATTQQETNTKPVKAAPKGQSVTPQTPPQTATKTLTPTNFGNSQPSTTQDTIELSTETEQFDPSTAQTSFFAKFTAWLKLLFSN